ncbi:MAG: hypothetical protein KDB27_12060 [Planctomycetales bacterium]|nr:hypothetical protein [Planctomycetales bacterium]
MSFESLGEIARRRGTPLHRVEYVVRIREIHPSISAGGRNLYDAPTAKRIESELDAIDREKGTHHA